MGILIPTALLAILVATLTMAAGSGILGSNNGMGIRTMATQRSEEAWQAVHKAAGKLLVPAAIVVLLGCLLVFSRAANRVIDEGILHHHA